MKKNEITNFYIPRWCELPELDLYLDQVVTFIDKYLLNYIIYDIDNKKHSEVKEKEKEKNKDKESIHCVTKTMINNYVKQGVLEPPITKKYNKKHIAYLFVICILKQVYSISDIDKLIKLAQKEFSIDIAYNTFCDALESAIKNTFAEKPNLNTKNISKSTYLLFNVTQSFASKLYVKKLL